MKIPEEYLKWIDARKRSRLSHAQIQLARELGMNPRKFGGLANHKQEPWKLPLPDFIEQLYYKRFKKDQPETVRSIEQMVKDQNRQKEERKARKRTKESQQTSEI